MAFQDLFVPPQYESYNDGNLTIYLKSTSTAAEFFEGTISAGFGDTITKKYQPANTFGSSRTFTSNIENKISTNYFEVSVVKELADFDDDGTQKPLEEKYKEVLLIKEYILNVSKGAYSVSEKKTDSLVGSITLEFTFASPPKVAAPTSLPELQGKFIDYEISFGSNTGTKFDDNIALRYAITNDDGNSFGNGLVSLSSGNTDGKTIYDQYIPISYVLFTLESSLPANVSYKTIYWANKTIANNHPSDLTKWNKVDITTGGFKVPSSELESGGIAVIVIIEEQIISNIPVVEVADAPYTFNVKESDVDKEITLNFITKDAEIVYLYVNQNNYKKLNVSDGNNTIKLSFNNDFKSVYGKHRIVLVPASSEYGTGNRVDVVLTFNSVNDFPSITQLQFPEILDVPSFSDLNVEYGIKYTSINTTSIDILLVDRNDNRISVAKNLSPNGEFKVNLKTLAEKYPTWGGSTKATFVFIPKNNSGEEALTGNEYVANTKLNLPSVFLDENDLKKVVFDAFDSILPSVEPEQESKYLTHLANFGNNEQILINYWEEDNWTLSKKKEDELGNQVIDEETKSIIIKLYSPLPSGIGENSTFWITKLLTNPLIETVVLNDQDEADCPVIKGPNFNIDVDFVKGQSTNFESLDTLILSASVSSSSDLIETYLSSSIINTADLNIQYASGSLASGSSYLWENFVHFSSAKERVDNFVYKVQLIEVYEDLYTKATTDYAGGGSAEYTGSLSSIQEAELQLNKKRKIIQGFDGFEKFLYTSSSYSTSGSTSMTWPYSGSVRMDSSTTTVTDWYANVSELAEAYDVENSNWVVNNIPSYIANTDENDNFMLFLSMIGHHFDNIYFYTKAIERSRNINYSSSNGIANKLLYNTLKSMGWEARNVSADSKLWDYAFGLNVDGNTKNITPAKQRNFEIWRRIINNLPYLLKHKGTRRGIYALLACYGVPSSNLSILEFGGPEIDPTSEAKSKFVFDNITTALKFTTAASVEIPWAVTDKNRTPDTIELFLKPVSGSQWTVISGSGWNLEVSGAAESKYGSVIFNYSGSNAISSSILPIFNNNFFGISVTRTTGSSTDIFKLDVRQANQERTIFSSSVTASVDVTSARIWDSGSSIFIGSGSAGFSGSVDEFRLWSEPLTTSKFYEHVSYPEMINGSHISSSTTDLFFRLDFEYPKDVATYTQFPNVDPNIYYSSSLTRNDIEETTIINGTNIFSKNTSAQYSASAAGFVSVSTYPYQFEPIDRTSVLEIPDVGIGRYSTNKIRFESQNLVSDLSPDSRATKKAYDNAPVDSNRLGIFFSPTKELNMDIAKSIGSINLDDYIGNPADLYTEGYAELDQLREYYFDRFNNRRDISEYINLIKLYEKSMFEDIKQMLPARVKSTTGLLIEPHILERAKIKQTKPTAQNNQYTSSISYGDTTIIEFTHTDYTANIDADLSEDVDATATQYETTIDANETTILDSDSYQYTSTIDANETTIPSADSYQREVTIDAKYDDPTVLTEIDIINSNIIVGQSTYETIGFGIYAQSGSAIRTYYNKDGKLTKERIRAHLVTTQKSRDTLKFKTVINGEGDPRDGYIVTSSFYTETELDIQPFTGSTGDNTTPPQVGGDIISVVPAEGYFRTHYKYTGDLTYGLRNSFYRGCKNTAASTIDGADVVEVFITNPNTLKVNKAGRDSNEPILEIE